jgi:hypothetical protein
MYRSGTLAAMIVSRLNNVSKISDVIDIIVNMRTYRDSIVETPEQFMYILNFLGLNKSSNNYNKFISYNIYFIILVLIPIIVLILILYLKYKNRDGKYKSFVD